MTNKGRFIALLTFFPSCVYNIITILFIHREDFLCIFVFTKEQGKNGQENWQ